MIKNARIKYRFIAAALFWASTILFYGCTTTLPATKKTSYNHFTKNAQDIPATFHIFHQKADSSTMFIKLNTRNLLYAKNEDGNMQASVIIEFSPQSLDTPATQLTGKTIRIVDLGENGVEKKLLSNTTLRLPDGKQYRIQATITDENRLTTYNSSIICDKTYQSRSHFAIYDSTSTAPLFTDRIKANYSYTIESAHSKTKTLEARYYNREFERPPPPFVPFEHKRFNYEADAVFTLNLDENWRTEFAANNKGFYHFQLDSTANRNGLTLFVSSDEFPYVKYIENMIEPFRYLVSKKDYLKVVNAENPRTELENFWIEWSGSKERARKSIEAYYTRIEEANKLFSSHVEGWKTDRGIIYAVYGKPNKVYTNNTVETWIYGEEENPMSITFNFVQVINPFTNNDYRLIRDEIYKPSWYHALNACRYGKN